MTTLQFNNLAADRPCWGKIIATLAGADLFSVTGGRGVINEVKVRRPDYALREHSLPASDPYHRGPTVPGSTYTDVPR